MVNLAESKDQQEIAAFCDEHGFQFPKSNSLYLNKDANGNITALAGIEIVVKIEPFIAENPVAAKRLYDKIMQVLEASNVKKVECFTPESKLPKVKSLYEKLGFMYAELTNRFVKYL